MYMASKELDENGEHRCGRNCQDALKSDLDYEHGGRESITYLYRI